MLSIEFNTDALVSELNSKMDKLAKDIDSESYSALEKTAKDVKTLVYDNMSKKRNAYNQEMDKEAPSTIKRKGFSSPLRDTTRMQRGLVANRIDNDEYSIEFTNKNDIYAKYLHTRNNWQVLEVTDYIIKNTLRLFYKNYGR